MALATQCPHCQTTFRVAHDQLKLRAGLVRCGSCKQIFNGTEHLLAPDAAVPAPASSVAAQAPPAIDPVDVHTEETAAAIEPAPTLQNAADAPTPAEPVVAQEPSATAIDETEPLQHMATMHSSASEDEVTEHDTSTNQSPAEPDPAAPAIDDLHSAPLPDEDTAPDDNPDDAAEEEAEAEAEPEAEADTELDAEEPGFVTRGRRRQRIGRVLRILMGIASFFLLLGLLAQGTYTFRNQLAARLPQTKPALVQACALLRCQVGLPAQIDAVAIESSELQELAPNKNTFALTALLRNHSSMPQAWPHIELTLNDANEKAIARRVFAPHDYLPSGQEVPKGFAPMSEQAITLFFDLAQLKAAGYRVYLFYP